MDKRYKAGVIGRTGRGEYGHGLDIAYLQMEDVDIVAVADDDPQGLSDAGARLGVEKQYLNYKEMLDKEQFDIVSICPRWVKPHFEMVQAVAKAGACIFLEKPISVTLSEADEIVSVCKEAGITIGLAHQGRMHAAEHHAKALLKDGVIGNILSARLRGKEDRRGGGEDLMVLGTHAFDTLRFLLDADPTWVFADVSTSDGRPITKTDAIEGPEEMGLIAGDHIHALFGMNTGITATFESRRNQDKEHGRFGVQIWGSKGIMTIDGSGQQIRIYESSLWDPDHPENVRNVTDEALKHGPIGSSTDFQVLSNVAIIRELLNAFEEKRHPMASAEDGRWSLEMIHGIYASHLAGKSLKLPLSNRTHPLS